MAVYAGNLGRGKAGDRKKAGDWRALAAESLAGFAIRVVALLIVAAALFAVLAAVNVAQPYWLAPVDEELILIPAPWSGQEGA